MWEIMSSFHIKANNRHRWWIDDGYVDTGLDKQKDTALKQQLCKYAPTG